jgi:hypothetical protein
MHDITRVRPGDPRVIALGRLLDVPPEACFERPCPTKQTVSRQATSGMDTASVLRSD